MAGKKTVIIGATPNPARYAYEAASRLTNQDHEIVPIGIKKGEVFGNEIVNLAEKPTIDDVDTITLYLNPKNQEMWEEYIISLNPKRIIFNPGTENPRLAERAQSLGIESINACTLTMLAVGLY